MKKIYIVLVMVLFTGSLFAQQRTIGEKNQMKVKTGFINSAKVVTDTLVPSGIANATGFFNIGSNNGGYIAGVNGYGDYSKAQQFIVTSSYHIEGVLIWFGAKEVVGTEGTLKIALWNMDGTTGMTSVDTIANKPCPSTELASLTVGMNSVDTSTLMNLHSAMFTSPITVTSDYAIGINMQQCGDDTIGIVHCDNGDPLISNLSWEQWVDGDWYTFLYSKAWGLDVDMAIFPVVDKTVGLVKGGKFINGLKLSQNQPNPAISNTLISYEIEKADNVKINIVDITGKVVKTIDNGFQQAGIHNTTFNTNNLSAGTYFYMLQAGSNRLAKRMLIQ